MTVLNIAEKPSVAKSISRMLSTQCETRRGMHKYCPNIHLETDFNSRKTKMIFTSVLGHLFELCFERQGNWNESDPKDLFTESILRNINPEHEMVAENIKRLAMSASLVIIWTDCDREGENIARQIKNVIETQRRIEVRRARFSAISRNEIENALNNLVDINDNEADAVDARTELDLRIGSAFTRIQTISHNRNKVISFGPCQIPTLNFVVQRYNQIQNFIPERFFSLQNTTVSRDGKSESDVFRWERGDIFDKNCVIHFFNLLKDGRAVITDKKVVPKEKFRPLPLRTVEFQKVCSSYYKLDGHKLMDIAEKLYNKGYISYPRTETDSFPKGFGFNSIINKLKNDTRLGEYATEFTFKFPRSGSNNDQAHSPIYPLKNGSDLQGDERKVFEFIARRFLGCVSENAKGVETEYVMSIVSPVESAHSEFFKCKGLNITERNYLDVYIYDKWECKDVGEYKIGEVVSNSLEITEGTTTKPEYLTESDLIALMDQHGIGTDATIHEHIHKIQVRGYARKEKFKFIPNTLGINLIKAYNRIELPISEPTLRKNLEENLRKVCEDRKTKDSLVKEEIEEYIKIYDKLASKIDVFKEIMKEGDDGSDSMPRNNTNATHEPSNNVNIAHRSSGTSVIKSRSNNIGVRSKSNNTDTHIENKNNQVKKAKTVRMCECGTEAKQFEAKKGENSGRMFFTCGEYPKKCNYFEWVDTVDPSVKSNLASLDKKKPDTRKQNEHDVVNCYCGYEAQKKIANTENNRGREFYSCKKSYKKCKFFKWADEE